MTPDTSGVEAGWGMLHVGVFFDSASRGNWRRDVRGEGTFYSADVDRRGFPHDRRYYWRGHRVPRIVYLLLS